jgi:hypothetical protein
MVRFCFGLFVAAVLGLAATADDKDDKKDQPIKGNWVREAEGIEIGFNFKTKDQLIVTASAGENGVTLTCKYEVKDGKVSVTVTEVKEKGEFPSKPPKGYEFKFKFKVEKEKATLSDYEAENGEAVKPVVEGEYKEKKAD